MKGSNASTGTGLERKTCKRERERATNYQMLLNVPIATARRSFVVGNQMRIRICTDAIRMRKTIASLSLALAGCKLSHF